jgi:hypothetical protein
MVCEDSMSENDVNAILVRLAAFEATVTAQLAGIATENTRGEGVHQDHETRIRKLETSRAESAGVWKLVTAGGALGASLAGALAVILRSVGV